MALVPFGLLPPDVLAQVLKYRALSDQNNLSEQKGLMNKQNIAAFPQELQSKLAMQEAQRGLVGAQTGASQEMARMLPEKMRIASQNAATRQNMVGQSQSRFSTPEYKRYIAAKTLSSMGAAQKAEIQQQNPGLWANLVNHAGEYAEQNNPQQAQTLTNPQSPVGLDNQQQLTISPNVQSQPELSDVTPEQAQGFANTAEAAKIKATIPGNIQSQRYYGATFTNLYNNLSNFLPAYSKYAGYKGKLDQFLGAVQSGARSDVSSSDYNNMLKMKQGLPLLANEMRRLLGAQATDQETKVLGKLTLQKIGNLSPSQVISMYKNLGSMGKSAEKALFESPENLQKSIKSNGTIEVRDGITYHLDKNRRIIKIGD